MSAYEMEKSLEEMSRLIKKEAEWTRTFCEKEARYSLVAHRSIMLRRMDALKKAMEGLTGMPIAATNRDKRHVETLQAIEERLECLEKRKERASAPPSDGGVAMKGVTPAPAGNKHERKRL